MCVVYVLSNGLEDRAYISMVAQLCATCKYNIHSISHPVEKNKTIELIQNILPVLASTEILLSRNICLYAET